MVWLAPSQWTMWAPTDPVAWDPAWDNWVPWLRKEVQGVTFFARDHRGWQQQRQISVSSGCPGYIRLFAAIWHVTVYVQNVRVNTEIAVLWFHNVSYIILWTSQGPSLRPLRSNPNTNAHLVDSHGGVPSLPHQFHPLGPGQHPVIRERPLAVSRTRACIYMYIIHTHICIYIYCTFTCLQLIYLIYIYHYTHTHAHTHIEICINIIYNLKHDKNNIISNHVYICNIRNSLTKGFQHHPHPTTSKHGICICSAPPSGRLCSGWVASVGSWGKVSRIATVSSVPIWKEWGKLEMKWESFLALYLKSTCKLEINFVIRFIIV